MAKNPKDLLYTKEHAWIRVEADIGTVGISDYAQEMLKDIVFVELPEKGEKVEQFKSLTTVESVKSVSEIHSPVSGEVVAVNDGLSNVPEKINKDPYGEGWIAKIQIKDKKELDNLISAEQYEKYLNKQQKVCK